MQVANIKSIEIGDKAELKRTFGANDVEKFSLISGDVNPVHLDPEYASKTIFGARIVHGALASSIFSTIFANILPGPGCIYLKSQLNFLKPIYLNQEINYIVEVIDIKYEKKRVEFKIYAMVNNINCISGIAELYIPDE